MGEPVRRAAVAGTWYPGDAAGIREEVEGYLRAADPLSLPGRLVGLISPHAGLRYSGPVAAYGYACLRGRSRLTVVLVGPSHRALFAGVSVFPRGSFETPLGVTPVDEGVAAALLAASPTIMDEPGPHRDEHSLEMQLPFLQHLVPDLRIVPVLMGTQSRDEVEALAGALIAAVGRAGALLVASSDLSHYRPAPEANRLDALVVQHVDRLDPDGLMDRIGKLDAHACGGGPMAAVMKAARGLGADRATILRYGDSGDAGERDKARVVGYLSAALTAGGPEA